MILKYLRPIWQVRLQDMTVTVNNFIEQSVIGVSSKGTYGWRVTGRPEALLDTATQERVKAIAIGCSTTAESCRQAVSYLREQCGLEHIVHGVRRSTYLSLARCANALSIITWPWTGASAVLLHCWAMRQFSCVRIPVFTVQLDI